MAAADTATAACAGAGITSPEDTQVSDTRDRARLSVDQLRRDIDAGAVDTVEVVMVDMQGRLQGKRIAAAHFLDVVLERGCDAQSYLLATDVEMSTLDGYAIASWETGYGNLTLRPDLATLRRIPWHPRSALVIADVVDSEGHDVALSPRQMLQVQLARLAERNWGGWVGTELEFQAFANTYEEAWRDDYRGLSPVTDYSGDYSMLDTRGNGRLLAELTRDLATAGVDLETVVTEAALGQHEVVLACRPALATADSHAVAKFATKHIAAGLGRSVTFMAKLSPDAGNACHIHFSLRDLGSGLPVFAGDRAHGFSPVMESFLAGQLAYLPELTFLLAPNVNSYKRFVDGSYAPTAVSWGFDNRTCALRVVGHGSSLRLEHRVAGADVNPHLALAAIIAAGLQGIEDRLELAPPTLGNAYMADLPRVPRSLRDALTLFRDSPVARNAFGEDVVRHYSRMGDVELEQFDQAVTDWEKRRGFERL